MRAAIRSGILGFTLKFRTDQPEPKFDPNQTPKSVLLRIKSAAINPVDYKLPKAALGPIFGLDVSGVVQSVGRDVTEFAEGDEVFGRADTGSLAEVAVSDVNALAKKPSCLNFNEAAALPVAYVTGLQGLRDAGKVGDKSSVLVVGASGGCGIAALHLAKALGAERIVAICSGKNEDFVRRAGATEVVDYTKSDSLKEFFSSNEGKFDCVYDAATGSGGGEDYTERSKKLLCDKGEYAQLNGSAGTWMKKFMGRLPERQSMVLTNMNRGDLETVASLLEKSGARPVVNSMPFTEEGVKKGFEMLKSRRTKGKVVFEISSS